MRLHLPGDDARRRLLWGYLVGAAAGALAGLAGGAGGRIAMLVLRLANPEVAGATSDDGFEMGQITPATFGLLAGTAAIGAVSGAFYVLLRSSMPARFRAALWSCFAAAAGGAAFVHEGGSDFGLDPVWFGIASFVLLPDSQRSRSSCSSSAGSPARGQAVGSRRCWSLRRSPARWDPWSRRCCAPAHWRGGTCRTSCERPSS